MDLRCMHSGYGAPKLIKKTCKQLKTQFVLNGRFLYKLNLYQFIDFYQLYDFETTINRI